MSWLDKVFRVFEVVWKSFMGGMMLLLAAACLFVLFSPPAKAIDLDRFDLFIGGGLLILVWSGAMALWLFLSCFPSYGRATHIAAIVAFGTTSVTTATIAISGVEFPRLFQSVPNVATLSFMAVASFLFCFRKVRKFGRME